MKFLRVRPFGSALVLALLCTSVWADDPWNKSYHRWNEKDVKRILNDSPWARLCAAPADWTLMGHEGLEVGTTIRIGKPPPGPRVGPDPRSETYPISARWTSSRTIRAAQLRQRVLEGQISEAEAAERLTKKPADYEITFVVLNYTIRFPRVTEWEIQQHSMLRLADTGRELKPRRVTLQRGKAGGVEAVVFSFPKTEANGEPAISGDERSAEMLWLVGGSTIKARFKFSEMRDQQGLDL